MAIWFQGCDIGCRGCCNPELQPFVVRHIVAQSQILDIARRSKEEYGVEGVTLIGGEPTLQSSLDSLARGLKDMDLGIILFTGRNFEDLEDSLTSCLDLVIDGRFVMEERDHERNLIGSKNQRIIEVSDRYHDCLDWFTTTRPDYIEIDVQDGTFITNGSAF